MNYSLLQKCKTGFFLFLSYITTSNITSYNITNSNNFSNGGQATLNTLVTTGEVDTQNILNVQGLMSLQSDMYGQTNPGIISPEPEFLHNIQNIKNITCESLNE